MKIYTKTGDAGDTGLFNGTRVRKYDPRVDAYGAVDELNAFIGEAAASLTDSELAALLAGIQRDLFSVGAQLADPGFRERANPRFQLPADRTRALELAIDGFESELSPLRQFILPGGSPVGSMLHVARTVCRRAERLVVQLADHADINPGLIEYLNRLSDFLFVMARIVNFRNGKEEIPW